MRGDRIPFSHILPVVDLALLVVLVFVPITLTAFHLYQASQGLRSGPYPRRSIRHDTSAQPDRALGHPRGDRCRRAHYHDGHQPSRLLFRSLISLPSSWRAAGWHPQALRSKPGRRSSFRSSALPFWWLVGCGIDGFGLKGNVSIGRSCSSEHCSSGNCLAALRRLSLPHARLPNARTALLVHAWLRRLDYRFRHPPYRMDTPDAPSTYRAHQRIRASS